MKLTLRLLTILLSVASSATVRAAKRPPNVIFILTDDQGWNDAQFAGHPYVKTPNLVTAQALAWARALPPSPARDAATTTGQPQDNGRPQKPAAATKSATLDRAAIFKKWDKSADGKLSLEEYAAGLAQKSDAPQRFRTFDTDDDGALTEEEFVRAGKPAASPKKDANQ